LLDLRDSGYKAYDEYKYYPKLLMYAGMFSVGIAVSALILMCLGDIRSTITLILAPVIVYIPFAYYCECRVEKALKIVKKHQETFSKFEFSVKTVFPTEFSPRDKAVLDKEMVKRRLVFLALSVLRTEEEYKRARANTELIDDNRLILLGDVVVEHRGELEKVWRVATDDFYLPLSKETLFKKAKDEMIRVTRPIRIE
jgi:hypothetical protein